MESQTDSQTFYKMKCVDTPPFGCLYIKKTGGGQNSVITGGQFSVVISRQIIGYNIKKTFELSFSIMRRAAPMKRLLLFIVLVLGLGLPCLALSAAEVMIEEWDLPTTGTFPHDPAVAPDGALWYTGMGANLLGRVDPATGEIREFPLPIPGSRPHGLVVDRQGYIWFTANAKGYIGKLDPQNGTVKKFPLPDPKAGDPHTLIFDARGRLWFTVQQGNFIGRLDPATGRIDLKSSPTPRSRPYGIVVNAQGVPFFCELGTNKIGRIDPDTLAITEYLLPEGARPRRIAVTSDDMIWYTDFARGYLGRLDPKSGQVTEWLSPAGKSAAPYGMAATPDGKVWYSESGATPNTIVRFDPQTGKFASWKIPSTGRVVRHMVATPQGDLFIACSGVNKVGVVRIK
jgi:virginiamycin B lyase